MKDLKGFIRNKETAEKARELFLGLFGSEVSDAECSDLVKALWRKTTRFVKWLRFVPFVRMVAVGNSLAFGRPDKTSDIDLFVITKPGRIFVTRTLITLFFQLLGVRRHGDKVAGRFCLSFYVTEDGMDLKEILIEPDDVYLYFWVSMLKPVIGGAVCEKFVDANSWICDYQIEKNVVDKSRLVGGCNGHFQKLIELVFDLFFVWWLEPCLRLWQTKRSAKKAIDLKCGPKDVVVSDQMLKFHDRDARKAIRERFLTILEG